MDLADRIIDENTKTFNIKADLWVLDREYEGCEVEFPSPVPVFNDNNKIIGSASLNIEGHVLVADIFLDYSIPERLSIETKSVPIYPHLQYQSDVYNDRGSRQVQVLWMYVEGISLALSPTSDARISPL